LAIYQETYNEKFYKLLHTKDAKSDCKYRLETCQTADKTNYSDLNVGGAAGV
jgi:hypothetical protein